MLTGAGDERVASEAIRRGVTDYVTKPSGSKEFKTLANRIHTAVSRYRGLRAERAIESDRLLVGQYPETPAFGLFLFEDRLAVAGHDEENLLRCLVESERERALAWGRETFADFEQGVETYLYEAPQT